MSDQCPDCHGTGLVEDTDDPICHRCVVSPLQAVMQAWANVFGTEADNDE